MASYAADYDTTKPKRLVISDRLEKVEDDLTAIYGHGGLLNQAQALLTTKEATPAERRGALKAVAEALDRQAFMVHVLSRDL